MPARPLRLLTHMLLTALVLVLAACADPPEREMQLAEGAINAARAAGADTYAQDELRAAEDALARAREAVEIRDYRLALNDALDSHERAQNAARLAADGKAAARVDADRTLAQAAQALNAAEDRLRSAERARVPAPSLARASEIIDAARADVQEARTAFDGGDYARVMLRLSMTSGQLTALIRELDTATGRGARARD